MTKETYNDLYNLIMERILELDGRIEKALSEVARHSDYPERLEFRANAKIAARLHAEKNRLKSALEWLKASLEDEEER